VPADCIFCAIAAGESAASVVHADDLVLAFCDLRPFTTGHTLVVPRRHAVGLSDVDDPSAARMFEVARRVAAACRTALRCPGVNLFLADGAAAWQTVFHIHLHVIPRWGRPDGMRLRAQPTTPPRPTLDRLATTLTAALPPR